MFTTGCCKICLQALPCLSGHDTTSETLNTFPNKFTLGSFTNKCRHLNSDYHQATITDTLHENIHVFLVCTIGITY